MRKLIKGAIFVLGLWLLAACVPPAAAEFFTVDTTNDTVDANPGDGFCADAAGDCSLRAAIMEGNTDANITQVDLTPGTTYTLTIAGANEDASATGDLDITERTYVRTPIGSAPATIDANGIDRVIDVRSGDLHFLEGLIITGGDADFGGGISMEFGLVGIEDTRITGNNAGTPGVGNGGGIWANGGTLWLEDSTIDGNTAGQYGGGIFTRTAARLQSNVTIDGNTANDPSFRAQVHVESGDLVVNYATITTETDFALLLQNGDADINSSIVSGDSDCVLVGTGTVTSVGVVWSDSTCGPGPGDAVITDTLLEPLGDNGGPVPTRMPYNVFPFVDGLSIFDPACTAQPFDARQQPRPFGNGCDVGAVEAQADEAPDLFVVDTTNDTVDAAIGDGLCADAVGDCSLRAAAQESNDSPNTSFIEIPGGSTYDLTIAGAGEDAAATGDIDLTEDTLIQVVDNGGQATIDANSLDRVFDILSGNVAFVRLDITGGDVTGVGGGVLTRSGSELAMYDSRITANTSTGSGAGLHNVGGDVTIQASTVDANTSTAGFGGGLFSTDGTLGISNTTVTGNSSSGGIDSEIAIENQATLNMLFSTVIANGGNALDLFGGDSTLYNSAIDGGCVLGAGHTIDDTAGNVWSDDVCDNGFGSLINTPSNTAALVDNGGPVLTMMPNLGSALLDNISTFDPSCTANPVDARGFSRPFGTGCDIGAVEAQAGEAV